MVKNKNPTKPLTEEEIWDDSALVRTWDESVEEYQVRTTLRRHVIYIADEPDSSTTASMPRVKMSRMF